MENGAIVKGVIKCQIGTDIFVVADDFGNEWQVKANYKTFPEEGVRLLGHHCGDVAGLKEGVGASLEISEGFVYDVRWDVPEVLPPTEPEMSIVTHVIADGVVCFATRKCGCDIYCHANMVLATSPLGSFEEGQTLRHYTEVFRNKISACAITIL